MKQIQGMLVALLVAGLGDARPASGQEITEISNGFITFTNENPALYYRIEFKPNLTDPLDWDGTYRDLRNIQSPDAEVTVPVGLFFRVVGRETPWVGGTAVASDLLSGKTAYVDDEEIIGTLPNVGQQNVMPGTTAQAITQGYHDGTGEVAGDADLVAENIRNDITIFGVSGTYEGEGGGGTYNAALPKTGQTTSFRAGDDGDLQRGVAWPDPRFTVTTNGTDEVVTDHLTGLMWVRAPSSQQWNWTFAFVAMANINGSAYAGYSDWRMPNLHELQSLIDYGQLSPALPAGHPFTNIVLSRYWSSTTSAGNETGAWSVSMGAGTVEVSVKSSGSNPVWPVRDAH